jgi:membrane protein
MSPPTGGCGIRRCVHHGGMEQPRTDRAAPRTGEPPAPSAVTARAGRWTEGVTQVRTWTSEIVARTWSWLPVRCLRRFNAINGRDRAFVLAGQAFTTVIPLLIIIGALAREDGASLVADRFNNRFHLTGASAEALRTLFERPPGATGAITIIGVVVLLFSVVSLTRSLQRTFEEAWGLPRLGVRGTLQGLTGMGLLLSSILLLSLLAGLMRPLPAGTVLAWVIRTVAAGGMWLVLQHLLLSRRIPIGRLVPGAVGAALGQTAISAYSGIWMPHLISKNADQYGVIGVTFALVSWLIVIGLGLVLFAAASAELGGAASPEGTPEAAGSGTAVRSGPGAAAEFTRRR